jgi:capsular polysaccharide transport system permease protein
VSQSLVQRTSVALNGLLSKFGLSQAPDTGSASSQSSGNLALYVLSVVIPLILYSVYVGLIRSPGYVSEAEIVIQGDPSLGSASIDLGLFSGTSGAVADALLIQEYIQSLTLMLLLDDKLKMREHYADSSKDIFSRLDSDASREKFLKFYNKRVEVRVDSDSYIIHLTVEAYSREYAQAMAQMIVKEADHFVNQISQKIAREQMAFVEQEITKSNDRLTSATAQLIQLQKKNEMVSPLTETATLSTIIASLQGQLAGRRAQLSASLGYINENAPEIVSQRAAIAALEKQIESERAKQVGGKDKGLSDLYLSYQSAQTAVTVASDSYQVGLRALEAARLEASHNAKHLVEVSKASLPDEALVPARLYSIVTAFFLLHLVFFILTLIAAAIRDHRDA